MSWYRDSAFITVLRVVWFLLKHTTWDRAHWFGIYRLLACVHIDIQSWQDCSHWFGIDRLLACVHIDIQSWQYCAHWFGIDRLLACVCIDIQSWQDYAYWFGIDRLLAYVCIDIQSWQDCAQWFGIDLIVDIDSKIRFSCTWIDTVRDKVLRVRHLLHAAQNLRIF